MSVASAHLLVVFLSIPCSSGKDILPKWFSTRTSYTYTRNNDTSPVQLDGCSPVLLYDVARHGARIPDGDDVLKLQEGLPWIRDGIEAAWREGRGELTDEQVGALLGWKLTVTPQQGGDLSEQGRREHLGLGQRWRKRMRDLDISAQKTLVRSSSRTRCIDSADAHLEGMGLDGVTIQVDDELIRFYDFCPKYLKEVRKGEKTFVEANKLVQSQLWQDMLTRVSKRAGLELDTARLQLVWDMCRYERAWDPTKNSPWCPLFTQEDLDLYNFRLDLVFYYLRGYAYPITVQQAQPLVADMLEAIQSNKYSYILNLGHSDTLAPFLGALGLYNDSADLTTEDLSTGYQYDTSRIGSFSTNVEFVVFQCPEERRTMMFHQEEAVVQPACGQLVCSVDQVVAAYSKIASANFNAICRVGAEPERPWKPSPRLPRSSGPPQSSVTNALLIVALVMMHVVMSRY